jgi:hypothetical protein
MATIKKGILTSAGQWWKHLRWTKRQFWKGERKAAARDAAERVDETAAMEAIDREIEFMVEQEYGPESSYRYRGFER